MSDIKLFSIGGEDVTEITGCGADEAQMNAAHNHLRPLQVNTQCNRSAQGKLNQMKFEAECYLADGVNIANMTGYRLSAWLADAPVQLRDRGTSGSTRRC